MIFWVAAGDKLARRRRRNARLVFRGRVHRLGCDAPHADAAMVGAGPGALSQSNDQTHGAESGGRPAGYRCAHCRPAVAGAVEPVRGDREPARRQRQGRGRGAAERAGRWLHAPCHGRLDRIDQPAALCQPHVQSKRRLAGRDARTRTALSRRAHEGARGNDGRVHRLCKGAAGRAQLRLIRCRQHAPFVHGGDERIAQARHDARPFQGHG